MLALLPLVAATARTSGHTSACTTQAALSIRSANINQPHLSFFAVEIVSSVIFEDIACKLTVCYKHTPIARRACSFSQTVYPH